MSNGKMLQLLATLSLAGLVAYLLAGILLTIVGLIFTEGSLIVTTRIFGVMKATLIRVAFTIPLSWLAIFLCEGTKTSAKVRAWFARKKASLSRKAQLAVTGLEADALIARVQLYQAMGGGWSSDALR